MGATCCISSNFENNEINHEKLGPSYDQHQS
jgi:hypothetical protein